MAPVQVAWTWDAPDVILNPGADVRAAFNAGFRRILLNPGNYGSQVLGAMPATDIWCPTYRGAVFAGGGTNFISPAAGMRFGGLDVSNYGMHSTASEGAMIHMNGVSGMASINNRVGNSANNAYAAKGSNTQIRGGQIDNCDRYCWAGGGADNRFEDLYMENIGSTSESDSGACKNTFSQRHIVKRICGFNMLWNGIWFDIQNQPALIEDIFFDTINRKVVSLEVSYGGDQQTGEWTQWRIRRVGGANPGNIVRSGETNWPTPSICQISSTPDVDVDTVYGSGWRIGVSLLNDQNHPQITGEIGTVDRSRCGLENVNIRNQDTPDTVYAVSAVAGFAEVEFPEMRPTQNTGFTDPVWRSGDLFRAPSGFVSQSAFAAAYPPP